MLIGISLGSVVTPETLRGVTTYPVSVATLIVAMVCVSFVGTAYLRVVHGWDRLTAYLAGSPGGLSQVMAIGFELGADVRAIAIVQTIRVVIIAVGLPAGLSLLGFVGGGPGIGGPFEIAQLPELAVLVGASTAMALVAYFIRFPAGLMFGAMLTSAGLHGTDIVHVAMPWWVTNTVMIMFGAATGSRFANTSLRMLVGFIGAAVGSFVSSVSVAAAFAAVLTVYLSLPTAEVVIAFAPGAVDAMMLLALALHLDPVYVGAHHLTRIFFVTLSMPFVARRAARDSKPPEPPQPPIKPPPYQD